MIFTFIEAVWRLVSNEKIHRICRTCILACLLVVLHRGFKETKLIEVLIQRITLTERKIDKEEVTRMNWERYINTVLEKQEAKNDSPLSHKPNKGK
jgi:hypothetical protein